MFVGSHDTPRYAATWTFSDDTKNDVLHSDFRISLTTDLNHAIIFHSNSDAGIGIHHFIQTGSVIPLCDLALPWRVPPIPEHWHYSLADCIRHVVRFKEPNFYGLT